LSYRTILMLMFWMCTWSAAARAGTHINHRENYTFPSWEEATRSTDVERYAGREEYETAVADSSYRLEKIHYSSDGLDVIAYLYAPPISSHERRPAIVFNRGSYVRGEIAPELVAMLHRLAAAGFTVVAPLYRESDGGEGHDEMGGADLDDLMNLPAVLEELGSIDTRNIFLYGESRGGMMVFQAVRDGFPARAAATYGAFTDLEQMVDGKEGHSMAVAIWPQFDQERSQIIERRSAIHWPERLNLPLLLMHGSKDASVPVVHTLRLATALSKESKDFGLIVFPGANHVLKNHEEERDRCVVEFFRRRILK